MQATWPPYFQNGKIGGGKCMVFWEAVVAVLSSFSRFGSSECVAGRRLLPYFWNGRNAEGNWVVWEQLGQ